MNTISSCRKFHLLLGLVILAGGCSTTQPTLAPTSQAPVAQHTEELRSERAPFVPGSERAAGAEGWWALKWSPEKGRGFRGEPQGAPSGSVIVRYNHFSVCYDPARRIAVWGAYTVDKSVKAVRDGKTRAETVNPAFKRPGSFSVEPIVINAARGLGLGYARDVDYSDAIDPRYPVDRTLVPNVAKNAKAAIQIGHLAPNNAMKCTGDEAEGKLAQRQSFSLANVVPQMNAHNDPVWEALEDDIIDWTERFDRVWVVCGPVFTTMPAVTMRGRLRNDDRRVAVPDAMFCVVVASDRGKLRTAAFIVPHLPQNLRYKEFAKSVDDVEAVTGLNFLPELGEPAVVEVENGRWLFGDN